MIKFFDKRKKIIDTEPIYFDISDNILSISVLIQNYI